VADKKESPEELARRFMEIRAQFEKQLAHLTDEEREALLAEILDKSA
jgi:hypothetical protein